LHDGSLQKMKSADENRCRSKDARTPACDGGNS
jgi:hypothetical protein